MAYSGDLLTIDGTTVEGLSGYKVDYPKLWTDAQRSMSGTVKASLIGIFTKLELEFANGLTESQIKTICKLLNQSFFSVTYFDPASKDTKTEKFYAGDFSVELLERERGLFKSFTVNLIGVKKR